MKIAVVNDIHVGPSLEHEGKVRASSHLVEEVLGKLLLDIQQQHSPDILINLGDLIRSENREGDLQTYRRIIHHFAQLSPPVIHLLGNHELKTMALSDIEKIWHDCGFDQKTYGCKDMGEYTLIWLGLEIHPKNYKIRLPLEQLDWLQKQLQHTRPTVIFTHCAIDDHNVTGNFFYETIDSKIKTAFFLENQEKIRRMIAASGCVIAVVQAHLHYFHTKQIDGIPYITCPAMGDNICGPNVSNNVPEIYTILTFEKNRVVAKTFSGKYCFAGYENG